MIISFKLRDGYWEWNVTVSTLQLNVYGSETELHRCWHRVLRLIILIAGEV